MRIALGADHAGFPLKETVIKVVEAAGHRALDLGAFDTQPVDYPDYALAVGQAIRSGAADRGILLCGSGVGVCVAANKLHGIRAGVCHDTYSARQSVEHDNLNVLCLGPRVIGPALAEDLVKAFLAAEFTGETRHLRRVSKTMAMEVIMTTSRLAALADFGQSVWYDNISRDLLASGKLALLIAEDGVRGVTSNPTIFEKAISGGRLYDADIASLATPGKPVKALYEALALADIGAAADLLRPVYDRTAGLDGYVSLEVSPHLAHDAAGTIAEAQRLFAALGRPNVMIKVPATPAGIPAVRELIGSGVNVNVTLIFALSVYDAVMAAYLDGLEAWIARGGDPARIASVASFFVSRVDTAVDKLLAGHPQEKALRGQAAIANARLAYARFQQTFVGPRWEALAARGARVQRPLWASTSTKNPAYPDTIYADALIGPHTVDTMPPATVDAFRDHGRLAQTVTEGVAEANALLAQLAAVGIDMDAVTADLLADGVKLFADAFDKLLAGLAAKTAALTA